MLGERISQLASFEMQKLLAAAVVLSPFLPLFFMGEEWSEPHPFLYFVSHTDEQLADAVREGRRKEFAAFHLDGEAPDPMAEETFQQSKLQWDLLNQQPHQTMFQYYKALIALRKQQRALHHLNRKQLNVDTNEEQKILLLHRWHEDQHIVCLMNFSKMQQEVSMPVYQSQWNKLFDSADTKWKGPALAELNATAGSLVTLQAESILVYANK